MRHKAIQSINFEPPALREVGLKLAKVNGINLAQGLCYLPTPSVVLEAARSAISNGHNLYSPAQGQAVLREAIAVKLNKFNLVPYSFENIIVTSGATGAFEAICGSFLDDGDEVINFIPFYPYHTNALIRRKAKINYVKLHPPHWNFDLDELKKAFTKKTKFILLSTPHNPTGKVFTRKEIEQIAELCISHDVFCVSDEVYEYMTYERKEHISIASIPEMFERCVTMSSYSKTFAITGWRVGYLAAPTTITEILKNTSDQIYICAPTPFQHAVATGIRELGDDYYQNLNQEYTRKRELMRAALLKGGLEPFTQEGTYYMLAYTSKKFPGMTSEEAVNIMVRDVHVGAVPASDFLGPTVKGDSSKSNFLRFCYAVDDAILVKAGECLAKLG